MRQISERTPVELKIVIAIVVSVSTIIGVFYTRISQVESRIAVLETKVDLLIEQRAERQ